MLLNNLNRIQEIDNQINDLHSTLSDLYSERSKLLVDESPKTTKPKRPSLEKTIKNAKANPITVSWEEQCYTRLQMDWAAHGVKVPAFAKLKSRLQKAKRIMDGLTKYDDAFSVLLIPPASTVSFDHELIQSAPIEFSSAVPLHTSRSRSWKIYIVSVQPQGYPLADAATALHDEVFTIADYAVPGLDIREYAIFAALQTPTVDHDSWSLLARDLDSASGIVPCVAYIGGKYQFEVDSTDALIGDNHFRPAMEIKG